MTAFSLAKTGLLSHALDYAVRGWPVCQLHTPNAKICSCHLRAECPKPGKHLHYDENDLPHGLTNATTEPGLIQTWWRRWPDANIGLRTGQVSGFVDVDPRHGSDRTWADLQDIHGRADTLLAYTGCGGEHHFFQVSDDELLISKDAVLGPGLDTKAEGGYVVAVPPLHESGNCYVWDNFEQLLAPLPGWLLALWPREDAPPSHSRGDAPTSGGHTLEGSRNSALASIAAWSTPRRRSVPAIEAALLAHNLDQCQPPFPEAEVRGIAASVGRYQAGAPPQPQSKTRVPRGNFRTLRQISVTVKP